MTRFRQRHLPLAGLLLATLACSFRRPPTAGPDDPAPEGIQLPPAWTATPSATAAPPTPSATATLNAKALAARQTAALWPPFVAATARPATTERAGWSKIDLEAASFWLPAGFQVVDMGGFDDAMVLIMEALVQGMVQSLEGLVTPQTGAPTPTPLSFDELQGGFGLDLLMAVDEATVAAVFLIGEPLEEGVDIETQLTDAIGGVGGEVEVLRREVVADAPYPTARVILRSLDPESSAALDQVGYVMQHEGRGWTIWFSADTLEPRLDDFEASALSLRVEE